LFFHILLDPDQLFHSVSIFTLIYFYLDQQSSRGTYDSGESQIDEGGNNERRENEGAGDSSGSNLIGSRTSNSTGTGSPPKKGVRWIPIIIIIAASIVVLLLVGSLVLFLRKQKQKKRSNSKKGYHEAQTSEKEEASTM
jgi:hypothetical protein